MGTLPAAEGSLSFIQKQSLLRAAIPVMAIAAIVWLAYQFWRLLLGDAPIWPTSPPGAIDLKLMHRLVDDWFAGRRIYGELGSAVYPPATYVLLWPLVGWLDVGPARFESDLGPTHLERLPSRWWLAPDQEPVRLVRRVEGQ